MVKPNFGLIPNAIRFRGFINRGLAGVGQTFICSSEEGMEYNKKS
jgi:hypothetical protein